MSGGLFIIELRYYEQKRQNYLGLFTVPNRPLSYKRKNITQGIQPKHCCEYE